MQKWITLEVFPSRHVAEMMRELLGNEGITAIVSVDDAGGLRPDLATVLGAKLKVAATDEEQARWILAQLIEGAGEDAEDSQE